MIYVRQLMKSRLWIWKKGIFVFYDWNRLLYFLPEQASHDELEDAQATYEDLLKTHEQLRTIIPNEQVKRRLEGEASFITQEWGEVYNREKSRVVRGHVEELRSSLDRNIQALDKEWAEVNEQFSSQGYTADLHERYQVNISFKLNFSVRLSP